MGHDISGYNKKDVEIAYIRYGAWNDAARLLYKVLDVASSDGGCSGVGDEIFFNESQIINAIEKMKTIDWSNVKEVEPNYEKDKLTKFLNDLLQETKKEGNVKVFFG